MMTATVHGVFEQWVRRRPDAVAVVSGEGTLSYAELNGWADTIASHLVASGVVAGDRVGVCLPRSPALIAALIGILKAGAGYVPVDPSDPAARVAGLLDDADVSMALVDEPTRAAVSSAAVALVPVDVAARASPAGLAPPAGGRRGTGRPGGSDVAYLMYTSGSTGQPKAVVVEHHSVVNLVTEPTYVDLAPGDRLLQLAPVAFDASTFEIWGALLNGARLVLAPPGPVLSESLDDLIREFGITVLWLTAALLHRQVDERPAAFRGLPTVIAGGDVLSARHVGHLMDAAPGCRIVNGYGPTEATTFTCTHRVTPADVAAGSIPIGRPIQNVSVHILDAAGAPVPAGTAGELWIGGAGVARGYWRRPDLTARSFVARPAVAGGAVLYRSGDLARRRADGVIEFLGRLDAQFKVRGFRVEPGEVENALMSHPQVRRAAVAVRTNGADARLVAYVVSATGAPPDRRELRAFLRERLPSHLVPAVVVVLAEIPVTPNGKTDRGALPTPDWTRRDTYV